MNVAIVGTGYVGMVTGACLAAAGHRVACVDTDPTRVAAIAAGQTPIHEPGLAPLVARGAVEGRLTATTDLAAAVGAAEVVMICVGTPSEGGRIDLGPVDLASAQIGAALTAPGPWRVVVVKSTVVPGTTDTVVRAALEQASGLEAGRGFGLAMNPEFLSQGSAVSDFQRPDRIVVGAWDDASGAIVAALYQGFDAPLLRTSLRNAEMIKYAANAFQATLISFANQIGAICEKVPGADEAQVMAGVHLDRLLNPVGVGAGVAIQAGATRFLRAGIGFGGSCFPKDLLALRHFAKGLGARTAMLDAVIETNMVRPDQVLDLLELELGGLKGRVVGVLGLAFKPDTDDLRESPGLALIERLLERGAEVRGHDPLSPALARARGVVDARVCLTDDGTEALAGADAAIIATAWPDYRAWDWARLAGSMRMPLVLDGRNLFSSGGLPPSVVHRRIGVGRILGAKPRTP